MVVAHPEYCRGNRWPNVELPELRGAFRDLGGYPGDVSCGVTCDAQILLHQ